LRRPRAPPRPPRSSTGSFTWGHRDAIADGRPARHGDGHSSSRSACSPARPRWNRRANLRARRRRLRGARRHGHGLILGITAMAFYAVFPRPVQSLISTSKSPPPPTCSGCSPSTTRNASCRPLKRRELLIDPIPVRAMNFANEPNPEVFGFQIAPMVDILLGCSYFSLSPGICPERKRARRENPSAKKAKEAANLRRPGGW